MWTSGINVGIGTPTKEDRIIVNWEVEAMEMTNMGGGGKTGGKGMGLKG